MDAARKLAVLNEISAHRVYESQNAITSLMLGLKAERRSAPKKGGRPLSRVLARLNSRVRKARLAARVEALKAELAAEGVSL